ncbi:putative double-stranded RNA-binding domain-containing protein [Helianthus annuus]|nr:putative double-stranded RNA-binding domain-containing protein [Helianthus annuus]
MYKNQLQELAQRSCFNLPSYTCIREGPDHAPRFKATVNFNGETYESPNYCTTLRQAEHSAAEVALGELACQGPSNSLAARILDETGVYKNLLQEVSQRVGSSLPTYTTVRSGLGHLPVFTCTVELAGCTFTGAPAKNKKQAEKNAAMSAWSSLKLLTQQQSESSLLLQKGNTEEQEHVIVARALQKFRLKARMSNIPFPIRFHAPKPKTPNAAQPPPSTTSKILPLICPKMDPSRRRQTTANEPPSPASQSAENPALPRQHKFPAVGAAPYIPVRHLRAIAPPVTIRNSIPVFSAPPLPRSPHMGVAPPPPNHLSQFGRPSVPIAPPVTVRHAVPVFAAPIKPVTSSVTPTEVKKNTGSEEDSKSPLAMSALPTEDKDATKLDLKGLHCQQNTGSDEDSKSPLAMSALPTEDEDATKLDLKGLQI